MVMLVGDSAGVKRRAYGSKVLLRALIQGIPDTRQRGNDWLVLQVLQSEAPASRLVTARRYADPCPARMRQTRNSSAARRACTYRGRSVADPTELSSSFQPVMPSSTSKVASISSTSASRNGDSLPALGGPITSAPIW